MTTTQLIKTLTAHIQSTNGDYLVEYATKSEANLKADSIPNDGALAVIREIKGWGMTTPSMKAQGFARAGYVRTTNVEISFARFSDVVNGYAGLGDTEASAGRYDQTRMAIQERIECEVVIPFIQDISSKGAFPEPIETGAMKVTYENYTMDANEVAVTLSFVITQKTTCI